MLDFWGSEALSRRCRVCCGFFFGRCGLPLPRRHPIITLVGAPVPGAEPETLNQSGLIRRVMQQENLAVCRCRGATPSSCSPMHFCWHRASPMRPMC